jgi:3-isopropylmalate/(R)-2-methylmalate dehydratase small subunit
MMEPFRNLEATALPLPQPNIDTDQIIPARFLRKPRSKEYAGYLFHDLRFQSDGSKRPEFLLNAVPYRQSRIIVAGDNFGCGSSRENAVWALYDYGFRVAIAPRFGDIFATNCQKNGFLAIPVAPELAAWTLKTLLASPGARIAVDLSAQTLTLAEGVVTEFEIDPFTKRCLLEGVDELGFTLTQLDRIIAFENDRALRPPRTMRPGT